MATTTPLAYNPSASPIAGTSQVGTLAIGTSQQDYSESPGGVTWWMGPDEELGYVIAVPVSANTQQTCLINAAPTGLLTLSTIYKGIDIVLSNSNQTASQQFGYQQTVLGDTIIGPNAKVMFSILVSLAQPSTQPDTHFIGFGYTNMNYQGNPYGGYPGNDNFSMGYSSDGSIWYQGTQYLTGLQTWGDNDVIDIVIDNNVNALWVRKNGGYWNNNDGADPASNAFGIEIIGGPFYPAICPGYEGTMTIQNSAEYGVPLGYTLLGSNVFASVGFYRSTGLTDISFVELTNQTFNQNFSSATDASVWLTTNGYWSSYPSPVLYLDAGNPSSYPGSGSTWTDIIGGKTFNLINSPSYNSGNGGRIQFNPLSNQYAQCSTSLPSINQWTVSAWHYYTDENTGSSPCIVSEVYTGGYINYILGNGSDTSPDLQTGFWAPGWILTENGYTLTPNNWYYIVGTYDGNTLSLYVNNVLVESTGGLVYTPQSSNAGIYLMSRWDNTPTELWGGYLSTVGIYDKPLTSNQVSTIWNSQKGRFGYTGLTFTITSSDFSGYGSGYGVTPNGTLGFTNAGVSNTIDSLYSLNTPNGTIASQINTVFTNAGMNQNYDGYLFNVTWGPGSTSSTLVRLGWSSSGQQLFVSVIDPAYNGYLSGNSSPSLAGTFNLPATFTAVQPALLIAGSTWC
jgi:hypothetical protein